MTAFTDEDFGFAPVARPRRPAPTATPTPAPSPEPDPAPAQEPTPAPQKRTPTRHTRPATPKAAKAPRSPRKAVEAVSEAAEGDWPQIGPYDPTIGATGPSRKLGNRYDDGLLRLVDSVHLTWNGAGNSSMPATKRIRVGQSTIMEALLRVGLHYIDDPDLFRVMRADGRRSGGNATFPIPPGLPRECDPWAEPLDWTQTTGTLTRHTGYCRITLSETLDEALMRWYFAHPEFQMTHGSHPGAHAFREALMRIAVKHLTTKQLDAMLSL